MPDPYSFIAGFMLMTAVIGFAFTAGRNYEKRQLRKRTVKVSKGTVMIAGKAVEVPEQSVPLAVLLDAQDRSAALYIPRNPPDNTWRNAP